jgi:DnaJ-class molecular chaperone
VNVIPEAEHIDARKLPMRFRETCSCCDGTGKHIPACLVLLTEQGETCHTCGGDGMVPTQEGWDLLRFLRAVTR